MLFCCFVYVQKACGMLRNNTGYQEVSCAMYQAGLNANVIGSYECRGPDTDRQIAGAESFNAAK